MARVRQKRKSGCGSMPASSLEIPAPASPRRPEIHQSEFAGVVLPQTAERLGVGFGKRYCFGGEFLQISLHLRLLAGPFCRATDDLGLGHRRLLAREQGIKRVAQMMFFHVLNAFG